MNHTIRNRTIKAPSRLRACLGGMVALLAALALVGAFLAAFCAFPAVMPLWTVWPVAAVGLAVCFVVGVKSI